APDMDGLGEPGWILLVDDNRMDVELTLDAFRQAHLANHVEVVTGGQAAIDYLVGRGEYADRTRYRLPALVLLDLKMPVVDGFEVLRQMKGTPVVRRIPVIILTTSREEGDRALSYENGANSFLVKPVSFDGFLDVVGAIRAYWLTLNLGPPLG
ncbi:MAG: response regulator, partial [Candidatus Limnocylindrales bacterium]